MSWLSRSAAGAIDSGPVLILAAIAGTGSFAHIRDTAAEHGQTGPMAWAVAVCIDLTCVMAARERQRDKRTGKRTGLVSWPTLVLAGGILLSLAANLAQAEPTWWGRITAATPCGAFLVAVSMLERRTNTANTPSTAVHDQDDTGDTADHPAVLVPASTDRPASEVPSRPIPSPTEDQLSRPPAAPSPPPTSTEPAGSAAPAEALLAYARRVADEHHTRHGRPITRDTLRARLGVSNQLASDLLRQVRTDTT